MTERKCVELTAVYDDGTVGRMTGIDIRVNVGPGHVDPLRAAAGWSKAKMTNPLRRVTVVRGRWDPGSYDEHPAIVNQDDEGTYMGQLLPDETTARVGSVTGPRCDFRICVEAVPVDEVKP